MAGEITADQVRFKKGRKGRQKHSPGRKIRNPELEAFALNFVREHIFKSGNFSLYSTTVSQKIGKYPRRKDIINHTVSYEGKQAFKGSKGWCDKFITRNRTKIDEWKRSYTKVMDARERKDQK